MGKKLFIGGISFSTTEDSLRQAFEQAGTVESCSIITDRATGRSKGFGFVEYSTDEEATAGIAMWDGKELDSRTIKVNEARPREERPRTGGYKRF